jgi:translation initiation factor 3 subunit D
MAEMAVDAPVPEEVVPKFNAPVIQDNATGWGPCEMPDQFRNMPYQPFSKGDRLGKVNFD